MINYVNEHLYYSYWVYLSTIFLALNILIYIILYCVLSGDLAYYDDDGAFYVVDRIKELIKYKENQVNISIKKQLIIFMRLLTCIISVK